VTDEVNKRGAMDPSETKAQPQDGGDEGATDGGAERGADVDVNVNNGNPIEEPQDDKG
jgi:hypothetical protein